MRTMQRFRQAPSLLKTRFEKSTAYSKMLKSWLKRDPISIQEILVLNFMCPFLLPLILSDISLLGQENGLRSLSAEKKGVANTCTSGTIYLITFGFILGRSLMNAQFLVAVVLLRRKAISRNIYKHTRKGKNLSAKNAKTSLRRSSSSLLILKAISTKTQRLPMTSLHTEWRWLVKQCLQKH